MVKKILFIFIVLSTLYYSKFVQANGVEDRKYWVELLYKISYPVIHNLSQGTLKKEMPLELGPKYYDLQVPDVTYAEAVGRTFAGIAPWLALPDDNSEECLLRKKIKSELIIGLQNAVNPNSPDYLNFGKNIYNVIKIDNPDYLNFRKGRQAIVDAAYFAQAFLRAPNIWKALDSTTKQRFIQEFKILRNRQVVYNNWILFTGITEAFLLSIGELPDIFRMEMAFNKMKEWYVGDGWYSDGEKFSMDYYNSYVIHPMMVDMVKIMVEKKILPQEEYHIALKRMVRHAEFLERLISPEGTFPAFGRSMTYRVGVFQALSQCALIHQLPEGVEPAQVRTALTKVMKNQFNNVETFDDKGWLTLGFVGHQETIADQYTSTGSLYICTIGFLPLGLEATDIFWSSPPTDWTAKKAWSGKPFKKDYKVTY